MEQTALMYSTEQINDIGTHFNALSRLVPLGPITSDEEYEEAVAVMGILLDAGGADENHPLARLAGIIGEHVGAYDAENHTLPAARPADVLRFLMEQHGLRQGDMVEQIGSQGVVSEILSGRRALNVGQISRLAIRFGVAPGVFITT